MSLRLSRDQSIVLALYERRDDPKAPGVIDAIAAHPESLARVRSLPTMVLRHGAMLTLEFLDAKANDSNKSERSGKKPNLAALLRKGLRAALPMLAGNSQGWPSTSDFAAMPPLHYIAVQDAMVVVAAWMKRLVDARAPEKPEKTNEEEQP